MKPALNATIRAGHADLFIEWHHLPKQAADDLWSAGTRAGKLALSAVAEKLPGMTPNALETLLGQAYADPDKPPRYFDGPYSDLKGAGPWLLRTDRLDPTTSHVAFASLSGRVIKTKLESGYYFVLGDVSTTSVTGACIVADGNLSGMIERDGVFRGPNRVVSSFVACRGNAALPKASILNSMILVDGDIDLSQSVSIQDSVIRASGKITLRKDYKPVNCTIEENAKDATAPYKFFDLADAGLSVIDDEEGLVVAGVQAGTPFGGSGLRKGDVIQAIDDARPGGHSSEFRRKVRRAMVTQGDCLLTVLRGDNTLDLPVYFPTPK